MQYRKGAKLDSSQMSSGGSRRTGVAIGGGAGLLVALLAMLFGFNPDLFSGGGSQAAPDPGSSGAYAHCETTDDIAKDRDCRFLAYTNSIQTYWKGMLSSYEATETKPFTGQISTGCGTATAAVGPFYCPADKFVYLDLGFFDQMLEGQLGAKGGDAAEAYVIAHEYGHHISNLLGYLAKAQSAGNVTGPKSPQVRLELQADCFAGAWLANASKDPASPIEAITRDDVDRAIDAAIAVGDDRIQEMSTGRVDRESWTHGSSAQRKAWMLKGYSSGDPRVCDTFSTDALG